MSARTRIKHWQSRTVDDNLLRQVAHSPKQTSTDVSPQKHSGYDDTRTNQEVEVGRINSTVFVDKDSREQMCDFSNVKTQFISKDNSDKHKFPIDSSENRKKFSVLKKNITTTHMDTEAAMEPKTSSDAKVFKCNFCDRVYMWYHDLRRHVRRKHLDLLKVKGNRVIKEQIEAFINESPSYICPGCFGNFNSTRVLSEHMEHTHSAKVSEIDECLKRQGDKMLSPQRKDKSHSSNDDKKKNATESEISSPRKKTVQPKVPSNGTLVHPKSGLASISPSKSPTIKITKKSKVKAKHPVEVIYEKKEKKLKCTLCKKIYGTRQGVMYHLKASHLYCAVCCKQFCYQKQFDKHIQSQHRQHLHVNVDDSLLTHLPMKKEEGSVVPATVVMATVAPTTATLVPEPNCTSDSQIVSSALSDTDNPVKVPEGTVLSPCKIRLTRLPVDHSAMQAVSLDRKKTYSKREETNSLNNLDTYSIKDMPVSTQDASESDSLHKKHGPRHKMGPKSKTQKSNILINKTNEQQLQAHVVAVSNEEKAVKFVVETENCNSETTALAKQVCDVRMKHTCNLDNQNARNTGNQPIRDGKEKRSNYSSSEAQSKEEQSTSGVHNPTSIERVTRSSSQPAAKRITQSVKRSPSLPGNSLVMSEGDIPALGSSRDANLKSTVVSCDTETKTSVKRRSRSSSRKQKRKTSVHKTKTLVMSSEMSTSLPGPGLSDKSSSAQCKNDSVPLLSISRDMSSKSSQPKSLTDQLMKTSTAESPAVFNQTDLGQSENNSSTQVTTGLAEQSEGNSTFLLTTDCAGHSENNSSQLTSDCAGHSENNSSQLTSDSAGHSENNSSQLTSDSAGHSENNSSQLTSDSAGHSENNSLQLTSDSAGHSKNNSSQLTSDSAGHSENNSSQLTSDSVGHSENNSSQLTSDSAGHSKNNFSSQLTTDCAGHSKKISSQLIADCAGHSKNNFSSQLTTDCAGHSKKNSSQLTTDSAEHSKINSSSQMIKDSASRKLNPQPSTQTACSSETLNSYSHSDHDMATDHSSPSQSGNTDVELNETNQRQMESHQDKNSTLETTGRLEQSARYSTLHSRSRLTSFYSQDIRELMFGKSCSTFDLHVDDQSSPEHHEDLGWKIVSEEKSYDLNKLTLKITRDVKTGTRKIKTHEKFLCNLSGLKLKIVRDFSQRKRTVLSDGDGKCKEESDNSETSTGTCGPAAHNLPSNEKDNSGTHHAPSSTNSDGLVSQTEKTDTQPKDKAPFMEGFPMCDKSNLDSQNETASDNFAITDNEHVNRFEEPCTRSQNAVGPSGDNIASVASVVEPALDSGDALTSSQSVGSSSSISDKEMLEIPSNVQEDLSNTSVKEQNSRTALEVSMHQTTPLQKSPEKELTAEEEPSDLEINDKKRGFRTKPKEILPAVVEETHVTISKVPDEEMVDSDLVLNGREETDVSLHHQTPVSSIVFDDDTNGRNVKLSPLDDLANQLTKDEQTKGNGTHVKDVVSQYILEGLDDVDLDLLLKESSNGCDELLDQRAKLSLSEDGFYAVVDTVKGTNNNEHFSRSVLLKEIVNIIQFASPEVFPKEIEPENGLSGLEKNGCQEKRQNLAKLEKKARTKSTVESNSSVSQYEPKNMCTKSFGQHKFSEKTSEENSKVKAKLLSSGKKRKNRKKCQRKKKMLKTDHVQSNGDRKDQQTDHVQSDGDRKDQETDHVQSNGDRRDQQTDCVQSNGDGRDQQTDRVQSDGDRKYQQTDHVQSDGDRKYQQTDHVQSNDDRKDQQTDHVQSNGDRRDQQTNRVQSDGDGKDQQTDRVQSDGDRKYRQHQTDQIHGNEKKEEIPTTSRMEKCSKVQVDTFQQDKDTKEKIDSADEQGYKCNCGLNFTRAKQYWKHNIRCQKSIKLYFVCKLCGMKSVHRGNLKRHIRKIHSTTHTLEDFNAIIEEVETDIFDNQKDSKERYDVNTWYRCLICNIVYRQRGSVVWHIESSHKKKGMRDVSHCYKVVNSKDENDSKDNSSDSYNDSRLESMNVNSTIDESEAAVQNLLESLGGDDSTNIFSPQKPNEDSQCTQRPHSTDPEVMQKCSEVIPENVGLYWQESEKENVCEEVTQVSQEHYGEEGQNLECHSQENKGDMMIPGIGFYGDEQRNQPINTQVVGGKKRVVQSLEDTDQHISTSSVMSEPASQDFMSEPAFQDLKSEPAFQDLKSEPASQDFMSEPASQDLKSKPISQDFMSESASNDFGSEPASQDLNSEPASQDISSELASQDLSSELAFQEKSDSCSNSFEETSLSEDDRHSQLTPHSSKCKLRSDDEICREVARQTGFTIHQNSFVRIDCLDELIGNFVLEPRCSQGNVQTSSTLSGLPEPDPVTSQGNIQTSSTISRLTEVDPVTSQGNVQTSSTSSRLTEPDPVTSQGNVQTSSTSSRLTEPDPVTSQGNVQTSSTSSRLMEPDSVTSFETDTAKKQKTCGKDQNHESKSQDKCSSQIKQPAGHSSESIRKFICEHCGLSYLSKKSLRRHHNNKHVNQTTGSMETITKHLDHRTGSVKDITNNITVDKETSDLTLSQTVGEIANLKEELRETMATTSSFEPDHHIDLRKSETIDGNRNGNAKQENSSISEFSYQNDVQKDIDKCLDIPQDAQCISPDQEVTDQTEIQPGSTTIKTPADPETCHHQPGKENPSRISKQKKKKKSKQVKEKDASTVSSTITAFEMAISTPAQSHRKTKKRKLVQQASTNAPSSKRRFTESKSSSDKVSQGVSEEFLGESKEISETGAENFSSSDVDKMDEDPLNLKFSETELQSGSETSPRKTDSPRKPQKSLDKIVQGIIQRYKEAENKKSTEKVDPPEVDFPAPFEEILAQSKAKSTKPAEVSKSKGFLKGDNSEPTSQKMVKPSAKPVDIFSSLRMGPSVKFGKSFRKVSSAMASNDEETQFRSPLDKVGSDVAMKFGSTQESKKASETSAKPTKSNKNYLIDILKDIPSIYEFSNEENRISPWDNPSIKESKKPNIGGVKSVSSKTVSFEQEIDESEANFGENMELNDESSKSNEDDLNEDNVTNRTTEISNEDDVMTNRTIEISNENDEMEVNEGDGENENMDEDSGNEDNLSDEEPDDETVDDDDVRPTSEDEGKDDKDSENEEEEEEFVFTSPKNPALRRPEKNSSDEEGDILSIDYDSDEASFLDDVQSVVSRKSFSKRKSLPATEFDLEAAEISSVAASAMDLASDSSLVQANIQCDPPPILSSTVVSKAAKIFINGGGYCHAFLLHGCCRRQNTCRYEHSIPPLDWFFRRGQATILDSREKPDIKRAFEVYHLLKTLNVRPMSRECIEVLLNLAVNSWDTDAAFQLLGDMETTRLINDRTSMMLVRLCSSSPQNYTDQLWALFQKIQERNIRLSGDCMSTMVLAYFMKRDFTKLLEVLCFSNNIPDYVVPVHVLHVLLFTCLKSPREYLPAITKWAESCNQNMLHQLEPRILMELYDTCVKSNNRVLASLLEGLNSTVLPTYQGEPPETTDILAEQDWNGDSVAENVATTSDEYKGRQHRIRGCKLTRNWEHLGTIFVELCCDLELNNQHYIQEYIYVLTDTAKPETMAENFKLFLQSIYKEMENRMVDNMDVLDEPSLARIGAGLLQWCYTEKLWEPGYHLLFVMHQTRVYYHKCTGQGTIGTALMAIEICLNTNNADSALQILNRSKGQIITSENSANVTRILNALFEKLLEKSYTKMAFSVLVIIMEKIDQDQTSMDLSRYFDFLVRKSLSMSDIHTALGVFKIQKETSNGKLNVLCLRGLLTACGKHMFDNKYIEEVYQSCIERKIYPPQAFDMPRTILLTCVMTPVEMYLYISSYLNILYNIVCESVLEGVPLTMDHFCLSIHIWWENDTLQQRDFPYLSLVQDHRQVWQMAQYVLHKYITPPLQADYNPASDCILINPRSLHNYLQVKDGHCRKQGLHIQANTVGPVKMRGRAWARPANFSNRVPSFRKFEN